jgi:hypothetical protein
MGDAADDPQALEREIRDRRTYSLAEAIGRLGGAGVLKGGSPVTRLQEAAAAVDLFLRQHLDDRDGALLLVLSREVAASDDLLARLADPLAGLHRHVAAILASDFRLAELVRAADAEWGRMHQERPYFELPGGDPHPDDPYTLAGVKARLAALLARIPPPAEGMPPRR